MTAERRAWLYFICCRFTETLPLAAVFLLPMYRHLAETCICSAVVIWLFQKLWFREFPAAPKPVVWACALFLGFNLVSLIHVPPLPIWLGITGIAKWLKYLLIFMMCLELAQKQIFVQRLIAVLMCSMAVLSLNGWYQYWSGTDLLTHNPLDPGRMKRISSAMAGPNGLAAFLLLAVPLAAAAAYENRSRAVKFFLSVGLALLFTATLIFTFSRSAVYALLISAAVCLVSLRKFKILWILCAVILFSLTAIGPLRQNFIDTLQPQDITISERFQYWQTTWNMIQAHPLIGHGVHTYFYRFSQFAPRELADYSGHAHNSYLEMWSEIGLFGFLSFLIPVVFVMIKSLPRFRHTNVPAAYPYAVFSGMLAFLIQSFFDTNLYALQTATLFWMFWGVLLSFSLRTDEF